MEVFGHDAQSQIQDEAAEIRDGLRVRVRRIAHALDTILERAVATFADDDVGDRHAASGLQHAHHFRQGARRIGHVVKRVAAGDDPGGAVGKGQRVNIGADEFDVGDAVARGFGLRFFDHRGSQVRADRVADARCKRARVCAGAARKVDGQQLVRVCEAGRGAFGEFSASSLACGGRCGQKCRRFP